MNVRNEIEQYAAPGDVPALLWLLSRYSYASRWSFVASCSHERFGGRSFQVRRVWAPTAEGRVLYAHRTELEATS